jgi:hypothetical protein
LTKPFWRKIDIVKVEAAPPLGSWNLVVDWVAGPRLLRFTASAVNNAGAAVVETWQMASDLPPCTGNGMSDKEPGPLFLSKGTNPGALIGKIGGSVADLPEAAQKDDLSPYPGRRVFPVGKLCVVQLTKDDGGPLFLAMNDETRRVTGHIGALYVLIEEAAI